MVERIPQSVARRVTLKAYLSTDHVSVATGKTIAVVISKNGGAFGNPSAGATNATEIANGWYYVDLSTTDTGTQGPLIVRGTASGVDDVEPRFHVVDAHNAGFDGIPAAAAEASGGLATLSAAQASGGAVPANTKQLGGSAQSATDLKDFADTGYDPATHKVEGLKTADALTANNDKTGYALTSAYDPAKTAAQAGDAMTLTAAYDAAKTAATQASVDDLPTNAELATALGTADDAVLAAFVTLATAIDALPTNSELATALSGLSIPTAAQVATAIGTREPLAGFTYDRLLRIAAAVGAGHFTGPAAGEAGTATLKEVGTGATAALVTATVDEDANRTITAIGT